MNLPAPSPTPDDTDGQGPVAEPADPDGRRPVAEPADPDRHSAAGRPTPAAESARPALTRRQLDEIFGDVLPTVTRDELDDGRDRAVDDDRERWYRDNRPPHHG